ncbi:unnamed protein product [Linum trigynum]|uniref:Uncharacterized protein n=1 Tax=Linum trigynum TaxID=586398 RepID=A0AAV2EG54_9ROSI
MDNEKQQPFIGAGDWEEKREKRRSRKKETGNSVFHGGKSELSLFPVEKKMKERSKKKSEGKAGKSFWRLRKMIL